jgi:translation elongation factor P/translation initiation factor 5A
MISTGDLKKGVTIEWTASLLDYGLAAPSDRARGAIVRIKLKNLRSGAISRAPTTTAAPPRHI